ncbi:hypothetical protein CPB84DRAFT_1790221 [Gymnopilus junonius]|uniref:Uncharacterized protein n=1 Tax=Gymnopilus junonius TaxID=109634 RepID=A0A9P5NH25_GYMJU|nr:hypothetical protein CPB84DRAFT_1790221 [Gymnopilus junonius]
MWLLSSYAPAKLESVLAVGLDEELRVKVYMARKAGNMNKYVQYRSNQMVAADAAFANARANSQRAYKQAAKLVPPSTSSSAFPSTSSAFSNTSTSTPSAFASTSAPSVFSTPSTTTTTSAFGLPSSSTSTSVFGQSAFGQPSLGQSTFSQPAFRQTSAPTTTSAFFRTFSNIYILTLFLTIPSRRIHIQIKQRTSIYMLA